MEDEQKQFSWRVGSSVLYGSDIVPKVPAESCLRSSSACKARVLA